MIAYGLTKSTNFIIKPILFTLKRIDFGKSSGKLSKKFILENDKGVTSKRAAMLNKIYVQALMSIMSTGKNSNNLHQLGIHITKVKLSDNLKVLNIYWVSSNSTNFTDENVKNILDQTASELQNHITSYRITGRTPCVKFVRDLTQQSYLEVQNILLTLKEEETTKPSTDPLSDDEDETLIEYTQDVLGLDHAKIMGRIVVAKSKSKTFDLSPNHSERGKVEKLIPFDRKTFEKFYLRKHILAKKMKKFEYRPNHGSNFHECYEIDEDLVEKFYPSHEISESFEENEQDEYVTFNEGEEES